MVRWEIHRITHLHISISPSHYDPYGKHLKFSFVFLEKNMIHARKWPAKLAGRFLGFPGVETPGGSWMDGVMENLLLEMGVVFFVFHHVEIMENPKI